MFDRQVRTYGPTEQAAQETIRICRDRGVLREYLREREKEVVDIMIMLFDQQYATEAYARRERKEGIAEGLAQGMAQGMSKGSLSVLDALVGDGVISREDAARRAGMTPDRFDEAVRKLTEEA